MNMILKIQSREMLKIQHLPLWQKIINSLQEDLDCIPMDATDVLMIYQKLIHYQQNKFLNQMVNFTNLPKPVTDIKNTIKLIMLMFHMFLLNLKSQLEMDHKNGNMCSLKDQREDCKLYAKLENHMLMMSSKLDLE